MNCYNIRIVWVLYEILKKNLEVYDDVTKAFEIRSNEFKYVLTKKQVHALYREQAASFERKLKIL
jgi:hypothetical protein